jgi:AcrR family transcriptional regulator
MRLVSTTDGSAAVTDRRLLRGARTRQAIARHAVDVASLEGLTGLSLGRLATDLGISKSGIQTLFGTKENLQLAAVAAAREAFLDAVVRPARAEPHGVPRLRALVEHWIDYAQTPLFPGGCFRAANLADQDGRPGPVRDALFRDQQDWLDLLTGELRHAADTGQVPGLDPDLTAFQLDAVLCATNTALRVGDADAVPRLRRALTTLLGTPTG